MFLKMSSNAEEYRLQYITIVIFISVRIGVNETAVPTSIDPTEEKVLKNMKYIFH